MTEHYTRNTESATKFCNRCNRPTQHAVSDARLGRCLEHESPQFSKKQIANQNRLARQSEKDAPPKGLFE